MASIVPERSFLGPRLSHGCAGQDYPRRPERSAKTLRARGGDRSRHKRGFPRWCGRIRRADGPDGPPFRRRPNSPGDPLPATKEACEEKGWGPKGHASFVESGRPTGAASDPTATAPNLETTRAVRPRSARGDCARELDAPRSGRSFTEDEPSPLLVASWRDPSSDRVQGRPRGRADRQ